MELIPGLTIREVEQKGHFKGELKQFFRKYSGKRLKCSTCSREIQINEGTIYVNLYVKDSLREKLRSSLGKKVSKKDISEETRENELRVSNSSTAQAIIKCPNCKSGYSSHDRYWESFLIEE